MGIEALALTSIAAIGSRPRLSEALFRFTKWGNPFADERFIWPYPMYERMRADGPVTYGRPYRQWFVFGYDEVQQVLRSPDTATAPVGELLLSTKQYRKLSPPARASFARWLLAKDPPDHTRLRSAVNRAFTPRQIGRYEPLVATVADDLLFTLPESGEIDIVAAFTDRLPVHVIAELLGLPAARRPWLHRTSRALAGMLEPLTKVDPASMSDRFTELDAYFRSLIDDRRQRPGVDLISALAADDDDGPVLDTDEMVAMIGFLLFAGHETMTGLLGTSLIALAIHRDQRELLRSTPDLVDNAVEELLRWDPPVQVSARQATADISIGTTTIRKGDNVGLLIGAANRDKRRWPDADELHLDRPNPQPLSFGFGAHHCLGAALARMQLRTVLPLLLDRLGDYEIDLANTSWKRSFALRGPTKLPLTADRRHTVP